MYQRHTPCYNSTSLIALPTGCNQSREVPSQFLTNSYEGQGTSWHKQTVTKGGLLLTWCSYCASDLHIVLGFTRVKENIKENYSHSPSLSGYGTTNILSPKKMTSRGRCFGLCFWGTSIDLISLHPQSMLILCKLPGSCTTWASVDTQRKVGREKN